MDDKAKDINLEEGLNENEMDELIRNILYDKYIDEEDYESASVIEFNLEEDDEVMIDKEDEK